jgi:hypothetical protein
MQEIMPTLIPGRRQHRRPFQANLGSRSMFVPRFRFMIAPLMWTMYSRLDNAIFTADQTDDLQWFFRGFYTKRVAGVQKLSEVGEMLTVI